ncbi:hypothetical protein J6P92_00885 [bacterium]|nr:hypothetical protein [bacterium]
MTTNWAYNLDMLAQNGVLDFDAPSFVMGQNPRYVGRPMRPPSPYAGQIPPAPAINQPEIDEFKMQKTKQPSVEKTENADEIKNPAWKKWLFGALAISGLVLLGFKGKTIYNWVKSVPSKISNKFKNFSFKKAKNYVVDKAKKFGNFVKKCWNKFIGLFKSKKP